MYGFKYIYLENIFNYFYIYENVFYIYIFFKNFKFFICNLLLDMLEFN